MRIVLLAHSLRKGGGKTVGLNWIQAMVRQQSSSEVLVIVPDLPEYQAIELPPTFQRWVFRRTFGLLSQAWFESIEIRKMLRGFKPDFVISLTNFAIPFQGPQAVLLHKPVYVAPPENYIRDIKDFIIDWLGKRRLKRSMKNTSVLMVQSTYIKEEAQAVLKWNGPTLLTPPKVNLSSFDSEMPVSLFMNVSDQAFKLVFISSYYTHKNFETMMRVFAKFRKELKDVVLFLTLDGKADKGSVKILQMIQDYDVGENVINLGPVNFAQLSWIYKRADAVILPSFIESFSNNYIEAAHFSLPILTSNRPFARSICEDMAYYFEPTSEDAIAKAILHVAQSPELQQELRKKSHSLVANNGDWDQQVQLVLSNLATYSEKKY